MTTSSDDRQWPTCGCMEACTVCIPPTCFGAPGARGQANETEEQER